MSRSQAHLALLLAAAFWGFGNISQKLVLLHVGPLSAVCLRCAIAAAVIFPLVWLERRNERKPGYWLSVLIVSSAFATALTIQQIAYLQATVVNASFLVNTATIFTPLIAWLLLREHPGWHGGVAAGLTLLGIFLMSGGGTSIAEMNGGDMACLVSAVFYAFWMIALGQHAQRYGLPVTSAFLQFLIATLAALPLFLAFESPRLTDVVAAGPNLLILGICTTAIAFGLQTHAQRFTTASKAAVLVSAESIFGAIGAFVVLNERPSVVIMAGAVIIFLAITLVSLASGRGAELVSSKTAE
jgi:drug/metabolite transporter (DMT)-like permease